MMPVFLLALAHAAGDEEAPQRSFVTGRFQLIGRRPDSLATYTGTATISRVGGRLSSTREIAGKRSQIFGVIRRVAPGEVNLLALNWGRADGSHGQPGTEAFFSKRRWIGKTAPPDWTRF